MEGGMVYSGSLFYLEIRGNKVDRSGNGSTGRFKSRSVLLAQVPVWSAG
jgi:hypothetical protein